MERALHQTTLYYSHSEVVELHQQINVIKLDNGRHICFCFLFLNYCICLVYQNCKDYDLF